MTVRILVEGPYISEITRQSKVLCRNYKAGEKVGHWTKEYEQFCISRKLVEPVNLASQVVEKAKEIAKDAFNAAPSTIDFAKDAGVNLAQVEGTGQGGRILKADVEKFIEQKDSFTATDIDKWPKSQ